MSNTEKKLPAYGPPPKKMCMIPWLGFSNSPAGEAQPCCIYKGNITDESGNNMTVQNYSVKEIFQSTFMKNLREDFRNNKMPEGCRTCWEDESNGFLSKRKIYNEQVRPALTNNVRWWEEPDLPVEYQMIINNSCNLKCRSCSPSHSTLWQAENKKLHGDTKFPMPDGQAGIETGKLWLERHEWYSSLKRLEVVGGEPMYIKQWHKIWQELIDLGLSKEIILDMSSNCTLIYPELITNLALNFKRVGIGLSVDGIGATYEYLRFPGNWETVYSNMRQYRDLAISINEKSDKPTFLGFQISYTLGWMNALDLPRMHKLLKDEFPDMKIWNNLIHYPDSMSLKSAPEDLKIFIAAEWDKYDWGPEHTDIVEGIKSFMFSSVANESQFQIYVNDMVKLDKHRNQNFLEVVPEYEPFLKKYVKDNSIIPTRNI